MLVLPDQQAFLLLSTSQLIFFRKIKIHLFSLIWILRLYLMFDGGKWKRHLQTTTQQHCLFETALSPSNTFIKKYKRILRWRCIQLLTEPGTYFSS